MHHLSSITNGVDPYVLAREGILAASIVILFLLVGITALIVRTASLQSAGIVDSRVFGEHGLTTT